VPGRACRLDHGKNEVIMEVRARMPLEAARDALIATLAQMYTTSNVLAAMERVMENVHSGLHTYSNLNHNTGYAQRTFSLSTYAGQTITLKFTGSEDYEMQTSFVIDDTAVNVS
jgi:hypothetical protein